MSATTETLVNLELRKKELESESERICAIIKDRITKAQSKGLYEKCRFAAENLAGYSDWGQGEYHYYGNKISISYYVRSYVEVKVLGKVVYRGFNTGFGKPDEVSFYLPGDWETEVMSLQTTALAAKSQKEVENMEKALLEKKHEWKIESR